ncbi:helix-turn-helix domain-containing protein [Pontibacter indicus]
MELIVTTPERLEGIIRLAIGNALNTKARTKQKSDRCTLKDALLITGLSKSKLYKLTSTNKIPNKKYGNRLIFSRRELLEWVESHTVNEFDSDTVSIVLARSARKKGGNK